MSLLESAIFKNNKGVRLLLAGKANEAMPLFRASLAATKQQLALCIQHRDRITAFLAGNLPTEPAEASSSFSQEDQIQYLGQDKTSRYGSFAAEEQFVFDGAFLLSAPKTLPATWQQHEEMLNTNSACTIFNLALLYQTLGMSTRSREHLQKAEKMYEMTMRLVQDCVLNGLTQSDGIALLVLVASKNNLAHIQFQQGSNLEEARQNIRDLPLLLHRADQSSAPEHFSKEDMEGFASNILFLLHPVTLAPAA